MMVQRFLVGVVVLGVLAVPAVASPHDDFAWTAPAECPDQATMRVRLAQRLGGSLDDVVLDEVGIEIVHDRETFVAHVDLRSVTADREPRTLTSTSCDDLADAVAMIVARVAPRQIVAAAPPSEAPVAVVAAIAAPQPVAWNAGARLSTLSGLGAQPGVAWGGELAAFVRRDALTAELSYARWLDAPAHDAVMTDHVEIGLTTVAARIGWHGQATPFAAWLVSELGAMSAVGTTPVDDHSIAGRWLALGAGGSVTWSVNHRVGVVGGGELLGRALGTRFALGDGTKVYEPVRFAARIFVGAEVTWR
jgi:hypothetical protein